jgi:short-subunit dehydrogenase
MKIQLKPIEEQTIIITGATSGIGLVTAREAARRGARVVVAARSADALERLADELSGLGPGAAAVVADVGREGDVRRIADKAVERFGGFDTWVNNAGVSIYGRLDEVPIDDERKLFETNFWGVVYGSLVAAEHLRVGGGAIVTVGSTLSDRAIPLQGMYCASKHAVKGFIDALRMELEEEGAPISVSLVKPAAIDTPYVTHARNYLESEPQNPPPVYAPEIVADAILHCATEPVRDVFAGGGGKAISAAGYYAPRLTDHLMASTMVAMQQGGDHTSKRADGLFDPAGSLEERGGYAGHVSERSIYTKASLHPVVAGAVAVGVGLAVAGLVRSVGKA